MTNEYMTEEEEKEYGTMRRSKIAGFSLQDDRNFTSKSSTRWMYLCTAWIRNMTMLVEEVKELERIIPNYKEVLKKYVEDGVGCPYEINTPEEFVEWVMKDKSQNKEKTTMKKIELKEGMEVKLRDGRCSKVSDIDSTECIYPVMCDTEHTYSFNGEWITDDENPQDIVAVKINGKWYDFPGEYPEEQEMCDEYIDDVAQTVACNVNSPKHYMLFPELGIEVIHVRKRLMEGLEKKATAYQIDLWSRAWEYLTRCWEKNGEEDIKKAQWYLNRLVDTFKE